MQTIGFLLPALGIGLLGYILNDWKLSVAIMTIGYGFSGATYSGHTLVNIYYLCPWYLIIKVWDMTKYSKFKLCYISKFIYEIPRTSESKNKSKILEIFFLSQI